jgi:NADH-quinone oxidoreductase subunit F
LQTAGYISEERGTFIALATNPGKNKMQVNNIINDVDNIVSLSGKDKSAVIPVLQAIQNMYNYLPVEALKRVCETTAITPAEITGVASFYSQFRFEPAGKHIVRVCAGTACHVKGATLVHDAMARFMKLAPGQWTDEQRLFTLEKVSCLGCCTLAPVVQIDDVTYGHVSPNTASSVLRDFLARGAGERKKKKTGTTGGQLQGEVRVGLGSCCVASGSAEIKEAVEESLTRNRVKVNIKQVGCVGMCHQVPLVEVVTAANGIPEAKLYAKVSPADIRSIMDRHFRPPSLLARIKNNFFDLASSIQSDDSWEGVERYAIDIREDQVAAFLGNQVPIATGHRGVLDPLDLEDYMARSGFKGLKHALSLRPGEIIEEIKTSGLRGRGGAGFPTGVKWEIIASQPGNKVLICNGDEGDPGAFMDRMLLESYPFRIIEGMVIAARAVDASEGIFYIRAEYPLAVKRIRKAIEICTENGLLGENILDSGFSFSIRIKEGAGPSSAERRPPLSNRSRAKGGFPGSGLHFRQ